MEWQFLNFKSVVYIKSTSEAVGCNKLIALLNLDTKNRSNRMRVQQQNRILESLQQNQTAEEKGLAVMKKQKTDTAVSVEKNHTSIQMQDNTYLNPAKEEKKTAAEKIEESSQVDVSDRKNQMAVLSHTVSEEDYAKMQEQGFCLDSTDAHTIITVTDKIKMHLAKAGKEVFGDKLDISELEEMTGNTMLASKLERAFIKADLPLHEENMHAGLEALIQSQLLVPMSQGSMKYLLDNQLEPTIENIYKAQFCGSTAYAQPNTKSSEFNELNEQIQTMLGEMGFEVNEETMADSQWLIANDIPFTEENLVLYESLKTLQLPPDASETCEKIADAVAQKKLPQEAVLTDVSDLKNKAQEVADVLAGASEEDLAYLVENDMELTAENLAKAAESRLKEPNISNFSQHILKEVHQASKDGQQVYTDAGLKLLTAKRQLEEARLVMTAEASYSLLKRGISIDTEPLAKLVDELKNLEQQYYANLLQTQEETQVQPEKTALFAETTEKVQQLEQIPAYVLGVDNVSTINAAYEEGMQMKAALERAGEQYETLMTAPRADMGDSIQKAFRNVDAILEDLQLEVNEENRRAVRILGYNNIDITQETVLKMKAADEEVQRMFKNMTPAVVTQLIKRGINPLEMKFDDLNRTAEEISSEIGNDSNAKFSEYLYKLEKSGQISQDERSSYIGIYRLIHQVEQTDGAAIGALLQQGAGLTMKNLLTAVRTSHRTNKMNISVDNDYGESEKKTEIDNSIIRQIETAYQTNCIKDASDILAPDRLKQMFEQYPDWQEMTPEQFARTLAQISDEDENADTEYLKDQIKMVQEAAAAPNEVYKLLERLDLPNTVRNVTALNAMMTDRNQLFRRLFGEESTNPAREKKITPEDIQEIKEGIVEDFGEAVAEPEALAKVQETLGEVAENVLKTMINNEEVTSLDIRQMRLMQTQLSIQQSLAKKEEYAIPVLVGDKVTNVSLKIVRDAGTNGIVDIMLESELAGKIAATFHAKEERTSGLIVTDRQETKELFAQNLTQIASLIQQENQEPLDLRVALESQLDLNHFSGAALAKTENAHKALTADEQPAEKERTDSDFDNKEENTEYKVQTARLYHMAEAFLKAVKEWA